MAIETIIIEPDLNQFCIVWKASFACNKKQLRVSDIKVNFQSTPSVSGI